MSRLLLPVALLALLCAASSARALDLGRPLLEATASLRAEATPAGARGPEAASRAFEEEFEDEELEDEEEECEPGEELEDEEGNVEICEGGGASGSSPPAECLLRTARARVLTYPSRARAQLVIRYTSFAPAEVFVDYRLSGRKGSLNLGGTRAHFSTRGVLRLNKRLSKAEESKVRAARRFVVDFDLPAAPGFCRRYGTRHLTVRHVLHGHLVWLQSDSIFGSRR
jgi:hypothetical protein